MKVRHTIQRTSKRAEKKHCSSAVSGKNEGKSGTQCPDKSLRKLVWLRKSGVRDELFRSQVINGVQKKEGSTQRSPLGSDRRAPMTRISPHETTGGEVLNTGPNDKSP